MSLQYENEVIGVDLKQVSQSTTFDNWIPHAEVAILSQPWQKCLFVLHLNYVSQFKMADRKEHNLQFYVKKKTDTEIHKVQRTKYMKLSTA